MGLLVLFGFLRFLFFVSTRARLSIGLTLTITLFVLVLAFGALGLITAILLLVLQHVSAAYGGSNHTKPVAIDLIAQMNRHNPQEKAILFFIHC